MLIDCNGCVMRDIACDDCVVTVLLGPINGALSEHRETFDLLAQAGLTPPLRLVQGECAEHSEDSQAIAL